ncbi:Cytochrome c555 [Legionella pneumophila]|uniref:c-type cytochrome n=1 Tax=Legionella pneumophila TaxID=446 RepID=UPI0007709309|nr:c-type cytochrome [Legionella pneumophila]MCZ4726492.1 c-type cytochrome [Legionella pneumophila]MDW8937899.1 c-type cytochrome [Legionella pneumophila]MDW8940188.1 c-type cytochrome [Legionella pneumophila]MDW8947339.1 c-type cytochrome [Legionella pneumophila]MDW8966041.1 c-type cytochrome [Legionella pneumophila]
MKNRLPVKLIGILTVMILEGFSLSYAGTMNSVPTTVQTNRDGATLWANNCARCHNNRSPTEYTPNQWKTIMLHMRITGGLTGGETRAITEYLIQASLPQFKTVSTASTTGQATNVSQSGKMVAPTSSGAAIYQKSCASCHGADGKGIAPSFPDLTKKGGVLSKPSNVLFNSIKQGIGSMPAKGGNPALTDEEIQAVLSYIKATFAK